MIKIVYVDDELDNRISLMIRDLFNQDGISTCELRSPPTSFGEIASWTLDLLLIDYDLASAKIDDTLIAYSGNSLATELRNKLPFCPIVLVSRREALGSRQSALETARSDIDLILYKSDIQANKDTSRQQVISLYDGFRELAAIRGQSWGEVLSLLGATEEEAHRMREAFPPIESGRRWSVPGVSEWIRETFMRYPGLLYDELHAAARLGISLDSFRQISAAAIFDNAVYKGIFSGFGKRWWAGRLLRLATDFIVEAEIDGPVSESFIRAYLALHDVQLDPSICVVDSTPVADQVCYILQQPVKRENSILYYPDNRPPIMDAARVSLKAIQQSNMFDEDLVDADSFELVQNLWGVN